MGLHIAVGRGNPPLSRMSIPNHTSEGDSIELVEIKVKRLGLQMRHISFVITAVSTMLGDKAFVSEGTRRVLLAAVEAAEREIDTAPN